MQNAEYRHIPFADFVREAKSLRIPCKYVDYHEDGWGCWTSPEADGIIATYGLGDSLEDAKDDYVDALKEIAECLYQTPLAGDNVYPEFLVKVMASTKEELKLCLDGEICDDF